MSTFTPRYRAVGRQVLPDRVITVVFGPKDTLGEVTELVAKKVLEEGAFAAADAAAGHDAAPPIVWRFEVSFEAWQEVVA